MITFKPIIRKSTNKEGMANVKIRVCYDRKVGYVSTKYYVHPEYFDKKRGLVMRRYIDQGDINADLFLMLSTYQKKAYDAWDRLKYMSMSDIIAYVTDKKDYGDIVSILKDLAEEKKIKGNNAYKESFESTVSAIISFTGSPYLPVQLVTSNWLKSLENHLLEKGGGKGNKQKKVKMSVNGVGVYMRNIRTAYNIAIKAGIAEYNSYPFRDFKIKKAKTGHRVISGEDIYKIAVFETNDPLTIFARDMFILSFYLIGINMVDMSRLEKIHRDGRIKYIRSKGKHEFDILVQPEAMEIINRYKGKKTLLDILDRYSDYRHAHKLINKKLKFIAKELSIDVDLTTYYMRHSWATVASSIDIPNNTISWALGHSPNSMTRIYNMFENKKVDVANRQVIDCVFKKEETS